MDPEYPQDPQDPGHPGASAETPAAAAQEPTAAPEPAQEEGRLLGGEGASELTRVVYGDGEDRRVKAGRIVVGGDGTLRFVEAQTQEQ